MSFWETLSGIVRVLLIMSVTGSVITLLLFALKPIVKNHLPKSAQYYIWALVLSAFLIPFSVFVSLPFTTPATPVQSIIEANVKSAVEWQNQIAMELYGVPYAQLDDAEQVNVSYREFDARNIVNYNFLLSNILILGVVYLLKEIVLYNIYLFKLKQRRLPPRDGERKRLPDRGPRLFRSPLVATPVLIGLFRPVIYLPDRDYSEHQLQNIMLHELTHWKRHDVFIKWMAAVAVCMHWFNPLAYLARREIDRACELSCDEAVIDNFDNEEKQRYGDTLIEMAAEMKESRFMVSTTMCEEKKTLKERLKAIMLSKKPSNRTLVLSFALLFLAIYGIVFLGASTHVGTAAEAVFEKYKDEAAVIRPQSIIKEVDAGDDTTVIFYYNGNGNLACAIVERNLFGYHVVKTGAELTIEYGTPVSAMGGQYSEVDKWCVWGLLREPSIEKAVIYGQEAAIVEADTLRFFYILGDGRVPEGNGLFYNNSGELVWEIPSV